MSKIAKKVLVAAGILSIAGGLSGTCLCAASLYYGLPESNPSANAFYHLPHLLTYTFFIVVGITAAFRQRLIEKVLSG